MKSIQSRFVVLMIVIVSTMLGIFGVLSYADSKAQKHQQLASHLQSIEHRLSQSLPAVIWRFDWEQIRQILDAELGSPAIVGIAVYDEKDQLLYSVPITAQVPPQWKAESPLVALSDDEFIHAFTLKMPVDEGSEVVGHVRVRASSHAIDAVLKSEAGRLFALILLMNLVIVIALSAVMRIVIMQPLNALRNALGDIARDGADLSLRLPPSAWREFEDVIDNFNVFIARLESALGASIDDVHRTIRRIAEGDFSQPVAGSDTAPEETVIARLGLMQDSLIALTAELRNAKQKADAASQAKTNFLANMSHEIRTPLNAILGMTRLAMRGNLPAQQRAQLGKVMHSANHLLGLINDILDFSKIEADKLTLEQVPFDLADVLENVTTLVGEKAVDKGLELILDVDDDVPWTLVGDPLRLSQIMVNFATNALKFTHQGEVVLYIRRLVMYPDQVRLRIGVRDTGIGIAADKQAMLFQSFVQADASNSRQYGGTGLGLAITQRLVQLMQGEVGVQSTEGIGSDFWCEVVLGCDQEIQASEGKLSNALHGLRMLVVDDHSTARAILVHLLHTLGLVVHAVESGPQALRALGDSDAAGLPFHWVLIDRFMPAMDGIETVASIQQLGLNRPPQFLMMSALIADDIRSKQGFSDVVEVLAKPVHVAGLRKLLSRLQGAAPVVAEQMVMSIGSESLRSAVGARVLLVEDIEINREVAIGLLDDLGIGLRVDWAENGQVALTRMKGSHYDVVFMDMHMPVMDGVDAAHAIRSHSEWDDVPIIAMTANSMDSDIQRCMNAGMCDFVTKPIDPEKLRAAIKKWVVSKQHSAGPTARPQPQLQVDRLAAASQKTSLSVIEPLVLQSKPLAVVEAFQGIAGLDPVLGLRSFAGKQATYREMLRRFIASNEEIAASMQEALDAGDMTQIELLAHAVQGTASNVGATLVASHARNISVVARTPSATAALQEHMDLLRQSMQLLAEGVAERTAATLVHG